MASAFGGSSRSANRARIWIVASSVAAMAVASAPARAEDGDVSPLVDQFDLVGPTGSEAFGEHVVVLSNGNYVVADPKWDDGALEDVGAVYLYDGATNTVISTLTGSSPGDEVGLEVTALSNGNFVVNSPGWDNGTITDAGAVTWADGTVGITGPVMAANSLVGTSPDDRIGGHPSQELANGNFFVTSPGWDNGPNTDAGAFTWVDGTVGITGPVSAANSLVGTRIGDRIGEDPRQEPLERRRYDPVIELANGNYVVTSPGWHSDAGAVTWADGTTAITGPVTPDNSLVGTSSGDRVGGKLLVRLDWIVDDVVFYAVHVYDPVVELVNGNYVVTSPDWDNGTITDAGAVTWADGTTGITGPITATNSLIGTSSGDRVGEHLWSPYDEYLGETTNYDPVTPLANGNYVVASPVWDNGTITDAGAVTWADGTTGITGPITPTNSLVGTHPDDRIGQAPEGNSAAGGGRKHPGVTALANGNFVVNSSLWDNGVVTDAGAVTWADGTTGITGPITSANSLVGTHPDDRIGQDLWRGLSMSTLTNGNYVVTSPRWDNGAITDAGAVTWADGTTGITGPITPANSLVGTQDDDRVGSAVRPAVMELANGNYVVRTGTWDNGDIVDAGAVTWADGTTGITGPITPANSLVGSSTGDGVGFDPVTTLANGNYIVASPRWDRGAVIDAGAVTWGDGTTGMSGSIRPANSLVGSHPDDRVGDGPWYRPAVSLLTNGNYVVTSPNWDNGTITDAGAVTWADATTGITGPITPTNSLVGTQERDRVGARPRRGSAVTALANGNYVVSSYEWDDGDIVDAGAVTWGDGATGVTGPVAPENSLVGSTVGDWVGWKAVTALSNGNYVVASSEWDDGFARNAGAVTWGDGTTGVSGPITPENSLVGSTRGDFIGSLQELSTGDYVVYSPRWDHGAVADAGAVTLGVGDGPTTGVVLGSNSVIGTPPGEVLSPLADLTSRDAVVVPTTQNRVLLMLLNREPLPTEFISLSPARILETRPGQRTVDHLFEGIGSRPAGSTLELTVSDRVGIPADAKAVALNVTAVNTAAPGFVTVHPCDQPLPTASNLNTGPGQFVPNSVVTALGTDGDVCLYTLTSTDLIVDVAGYFPAASSLISRNPARLIDTRSGQSTFDGLDVGAGPTTAGQITAVQVTGRAGIPANATAAALNLTLTQTSGPSFATIFPCDTAPPTASNINVTAAGVTIANSAIGKLAADGTLCIFTSAPTHLIVDVSGWFTTASDYQPLTPSRLLETRPGQATSDGAFQGQGLLPAGTTIELTVANRGGTPAAIATVVVNVTVTQTQAPGFITVYPCGRPRPTTSNLNHLTGSTVANNVVVKTSPTGTICLYNLAPTHLIADINGYFPD